MLWMSSCKTVEALKVIPATVHEPNLRSQKVLTRLGFRQAGVLDDRDDYMGELVSVTEFVLER